MKDRGGLENNGVPTILRQANSRFRRDDRQLDEDEEMWFNDDEDFDDEGSSSVGPGPTPAGEPNKATAVVGSVSTVTANSCEKVAEAVAAVTEVPSIDKLMEEDKKKELGSQVMTGQVDTSTPQTATNISKVCHLDFIMMTLIIFLLQTLKTTPVLNSVENGANKKSTGLVDYDSDSDEGTEDLKNIKNKFCLFRKWKFRRGSNATE